MAPFRFVAADRSRDGRAPLIIHEGTRQHLVRCRVPLQPTAVNKRTVLIYGPERYLLQLSELEALDAPPVFARCSWGGTADLADHRWPCEFARLENGGVTFSAGNAGKSESYVAQTAVSKQHMRVGTHHAEFHVSADAVAHYTIGIIAAEDLPFGAKRFDHEIMSAGPPVDIDPLDPRLLQNRNHGSSEAVPRAYGTRYWGWESFNGSHQAQDSQEVPWEGMEPFQHEAVGLTVDIDAGTLTAYKGGRKLGVLTSILPRENVSFHWFASIFGEQSSADTELREWKGAVSILPRRPHGPHGLTLSGS